MFDLIVGTSTGAIQAVSLAVLKYDIEQCEGVYTKLGHKVFNNQAASAASRESEMASWKESLYRMYKSGSQSMRVAVYGCKHDASTFESLLKDMCNLVRLVSGI
jgi:patatin-like phospholipase/acyl hydrolase